ncbi:hypothetical protein V6N11_082888 [Hibiscus sabdariffa]|uniref:Uncharacterized protein n=2 Tax=Hibiscus sabdariffa TaxID=183260 RepID=A0ABR2QK89_9ROSI
MQDRLRIMEEQGNVLSDRRWNYKEHLWKNLEVVISCQHVEQFLGLKENPKETGSATAEAVERQLLRFTIATRESEAIVRK